MKKNIIRFFTCLIPFTPWRKKVRYFLFGFSLSALGAFQKFVRTQTPPQSVLVIEPNCFHGEVVSGFVKYFLDLGFVVDVLLDYEFLSAKPLFWAKSRGGG